MGGVYLSEKMVCPVCDEVTKHITGWEREDPEVLDVQCTKCYGDRAVSGHAYYEALGAIRRLVQDQHLEAYKKARGDMFNFRMAPIGVHSGEPEE